MKASYLFLLVVSMVACAAVGAGENEWNLLANDNEIQARVSLLPDPNARMAIGPFVSWRDDDNVFAGGVFATYDLMQEQTFQVLQYEIPATLYVGGMIGAQDIGDPGAVVRLLTGIDFGDGPTRIGFEIQYGLDGDFWHELGDDADDVDLFFRIAHRF